MSKIDGNFVLHKKPYIDYTLNIQIYKINTVD